MIWITSAVSLAGAAGWFFYWAESRKNKLLWRTLESYRVHALEGLQLLERCNALAVAWRRLAVLGLAALWIVAAFNVWKNRKGPQK